MKLIIDIPDRIYKINQNRTLNITDSEILEKAVRSGIPLDDVKAELQKLADDTWNMSVGSVSQGLEDAIEILDNIGKESEEKINGKNE